MALSNEFKTQGEWLFRWRGVLPLFFVIPLLLAMRNYEWPFRDYFD